MSEQSEQDDHEAITDKALWDFADDLMDAWGVADENPPSLSEKFRDMFVTRFRRTPAPQQVSTVEELDALPIGCLVLADGEVYVRIDADERINSGRETWRCLNDAKGYREWEAYPALVVLTQGTAVTVLYRPEGGGR